MNIITIDGPAGSGKSTVARLVAAHLKWSYVTTGAIYRALAFLFKKSSLASEEKAIRNLSEFLEKNYQQDSLTGDVFVDGQNITLEIKDVEVSNMASQLAQNPLVREALLPLQRKITYLRGQGAVVDGRDMGTVVFPDAPLKIFLTASVKERAKRRHKELEKAGQYVDLLELEKQILERDERDENREIAPLKVAPDAILIDSTQKTCEEIASFIVSVAKEKHLYHPETLKNATHEREEI